MRQRVIGAVPVSLANRASESIRSMFSPAVISRPSGRELPIAQQPSGGVDHRRMMGPLVGVDPRHHRLRARLHADLRHIHAVDVSFTPVRDDHAGWADTTVTRLRIKVL